jgi:hypothetical protein
VWGLLACIEEFPDDFVGFPDVNGANAHTFVVFNKTFEGLASVIRAS